MLMGIKDYFSFYAFFNIFHIINGAYLHIIVTTLVAEHFFFPEEILILLRMQTFTVLMIFFLCFTFHELLSRLLRTVMVRHHFTMVGVNMLLWWNIVGYHCSMRPPVRDYLFGSSLQKNGAVRRPLITTRCTVVFVHTVFLQIHLVSSSFTLRYCLESWPCAVYWLCVECDTGCCFFHGLCQLIIAVAVHETDSRCLNSSLLFRLHR